MQNSTTEEKIRKGQPMTWNEVSKEIFEDEGLVATCTSSQGDLHVAFIRPREDCTGFFKSLKSVPETAKNAITELASKKDVDFSFVFAERMWCYNIDKGHVFPMYEEWAENQKWALYRGGSQPSAKKSNYTVHDDGKLNSLDSFSSIEEGAGYLISYMKSYFMSDGIESKWFIGSCGNQGTIPQQLSPFASPGEAHDAAAERGSDFYYQVEKFYSPCK